MTTFRDFTNWLPPRGALKSICLVARGAYFLQRAFISRNPLPTGQ